jgi:hypothetical protein
MIKLRGPLEKKKPEKTSSMLGTKLRTVWPTGHTRWARLAELPEKQLEKPGKQLVKQ